MSAEKSGAPRRTWALLYQAAVYEADDRRRLLLIARAKGAIERQQARASSQAIEERQALQDAAYVLTALRKAAEFNLEQGLKRGRASDVVLTVTTLVFD